MANVNGVYDSLLQGISQQPNRDRQQGQCEDSLNLVPSPVNGLHDRPPTEFIGPFVTGFDASDAKFHNYVSGEEKYLIGFNETQIEVVDKDNAPVTVTIDPDALPYLTAGNTSGTFSERFHNVTVGDVTLVCNRTVQPLVLVGSAVQWADSLIYFRTVAPGKKVTVTVSAPGQPTITVEHNISPIVSSVQLVGSDSTNRDVDLQNRTVLAATDVVAKRISDLLNANGTFTANYTSVVQGAVIVITSKQVEGPDNLRKEITLSVTDDLGGTAIYCINRELPQASGLPIYAPHGYIVRITGDGTTVQDDYFLQFLAPSATGFNSQPGQWKEVTHPKEDFRIDARTMPHALIRTATGDFTFTPLEEAKVALIAGAEDIFWDDREAGSSVSNAFPDFMQGPIQDMGLFQDRLFMIANESITFSRSRNYWNFFKQTATTEVVSDPINKASNNNEVAQLRFAIQHNRDLILFADNSQFRITGSRPLTPANASLSVTTNFGTDLKVSPVAAGEVIFFPYRTGNFSGIREFFTVGTQATNNARPITSHVERLIKGSVVEIIANTQEDVLVVRGDANPNEILVYHYLWQDEERVQAAWGRWNFCNSKDVLYMYFDRSDLTIVMRDTGPSPKLFSYVLKLEDQDAIGLNHNVYVDERITLPSTTTAFPLPTDYPITDPKDYYVVQGSDCPFPGLHLPFTYNDITSTIELSKDMLGGTVIFGRYCPREYKPSMPTVRDKNNKYIRPKRFTIGDFKLEYEQSGPITAMVEHDAYGLFEYKFTQRIVGQARWGSVDLSTNLGIAPARMPVEGLRLTYTAANYLPMRLSSLSWEGQFITEGKRI